MKFTQPLIALLSFTSSFGIMCYFRAPAYKKTPEALPIVVMRKDPGLTAVPGPAKAPSDPASELSTILSLPPSPRNDEALQKLGKLLLPEDPEAAFRAAMAQWGFNLTALRAAAEALVKKDHAAAHRLVAECPDLRSKRMLEAAIMADEVSRNPREKLRWADENLEGVVKQRAVTAGAAALAELDRAAALAFAAELPPGNMKTNIVRKALELTLKTEPATAIAWLRENASPMEFDTLSRGMFFAFHQAAGPEQTQKLLTSLPSDLQQPMAYAILVKHVTSQENPDAVDFAANSKNAIQSFPPSMQDESVRTMIRVWAEMNSGQEAALLSAVTHPAQRVIVVEALMAQRFAQPASDVPEYSAEQTLSLFQTPEDKQAAARVVPFFTNLTETQRQDILSRLK